MRISPFLVSIALATGLPSFCFPETFFGVTSATNRLLVASNEAIIIVATSVDCLGGPHGTLLKDGQSIPVDFGLCNHRPGVEQAISGEAELVVTTPLVVSYKRIKGTNVVTKIGATNDVVITVPESKTIRFFAPISYGDLEIAAEFSREGTTIPGSFAATSEFQGPIEIRCKRTDPNHGIAVSYYFTEDFVTMPEISLLQGPTGSFEITVQKSLDLTNWYPLVIHRTSTDERAFYRLKLSK